MKWGKTGILDKVPRYFWRSEGSDHPVQASCRMGFGRVNGGLYFSVETDGDEFFRLFPEVLPARTAENGDDNRLFLMLGRAYKAMSRTPGKSRLSSDNGLIGPQEFVRVSKRQDFPSFG